MQVETIETERLYLRGFQKEDAAFAISIWNDPEMGEYLPDEAMDEIDEAYLKEIESLPEDEECCYMIAECKDTHERMGTCSFIPSEDGKVYDIAYCVHKKNWRNGYATEMARGMVDYAKKHGASKVTVRINKDNNASNAIARKIGFEVIGEKCYKKRGTELEFSDNLYELIFEPNTPLHIIPHINHQMEHSPVHAPIPGLGLRSMKTALAAVLTALLYAFLPNSNPTFACIGAIFGMGADMEESRRSGGNRFFGTIIGGLIGLGLYWLEHQIFPEGCYWLRLPLVFLGIIIMISVCVLFHWPGGVQPGGVVLCIILFNTPAHEIDYAIRRMIDTGVGVLIALSVNYLLPRSRMEHLLHLDKQE